ncbi:low temperature requirement protein A [Frankia sp. AgKG'84/4]|uniref:low temperature requirement protein A n=1 Tax=Frankia sp. AgKG'84/4 TaxID=573490 RepID=UPI00200D14A6|nr:low temperature requirement protein A [Frankia sp. AgKG'84/4]MCL9793418.1 low temperature requirement protein A [Frankia sp. AgKG'84/4]
MSTIDESTGPAAPTPRANVTTDVTSRSGRTAVQTRLAASVRATGEGHRVTNLELFFDLVFVFAFTQVNELVAEEGSVRAALRGILLVAILWWAWCSYAWLGNQAQADEGVLRTAMIIAMGAVFAASMAIPESWHDLPGGLSGPLVLAVAIIVVRSLHLVIYAVAAGTDSGLRRQLARNAAPMAIMAVLLVLGAMSHGSHRTVLWLVALAVDYSGTYLVGASGWRMPAPGHFAERHGLIVLVALGESIVSVGVGAGRAPVSWPILLIMALGLAINVALWWAYFDVVALVAERTLQARTGVERVLLARASYTYLHFPLVLGVLTTALALQMTVEEVTSAEHSLTDTPHTLPGVCLAAGPALYLVGLSAIRWRDLGRPNGGRLVAAALLLALIPALLALPALGALGLTAAVLAGLIGVEAVRHRALRDVVRHEESEPAAPAGG